MYKPPAFWFYRAMTWFPWLGYRGKIFITAMVGLHIHVLVIAAAAFTGLIEHSMITTIIAIDLLTTLGCGLLTLLALDQLLRPVLLASRGLQHFMREGRIPDLPDHYPGQGGQLMADVRHTLTSLDQAIQQLSNYDTVTNLPNRAQFQRSLQQTLQTASVSDERIAVVALQIQDFDRLLGTFGQDCGDQLLRILAQRLETMTGSQWQLGRLESDCLALVRVDAGDPELLATELEVCLKRLSAPMKIGPQTLSPALRAGIAMAPSDGEDAETLIQHAFTALLEEREGARTSVAFFSQETRAALLEQHLLEQELRKALAEEQFQLHFQPVVDCQVQRVVGAEALLRWQHPEFGSIAPAQFIPVAEATGLMEEIGRWVIDSACRQLHAWHGAGHEQLRMAVNLSARQFDDFGLIDLIGENLLRYELPPGSLEVELTEAVAMADTARTHRILEALRTMGVGVAIDDFGTGHASMSSLRQLPLDKLKIDREFVKTMATPAICQSLISLSKGLGLTVVAEGVETAEEMQMLRERGCTLFQGYFFSEPLTAGGFETFLGADHWQCRLDTAEHFSAALTG